MKLICLLALIFIYSLDAQQIAIERIEQMPNFPQPYEMRDWKKVARGYDSLVFDVQASGTYLPLIWQDAAGTNYPEHARFGLDSYVGTTANNSAEAINVLPAVISASLSDIDKSNQNGMNWVLMVEDFFNNRPEENVYLNNYTSSSGSDFWYDTMPNIFFYQLFDLYPGVGDFDRQFRLIADRWSEAVDRMGGSLTPWATANINYRAWILSEMVPLTSGVREPEAAGALGWIFYNAFLETGDEKYRIAAEWAIEFLNSRESNPSYELQLPYGVYIAARMNADLHTDYDIAKLLNWCFTPQGNVREWGSVLGNWGGYDADGLIGEALNDGYAFAMNGFQQVGALVPMVKYDERFARAIGKWVLNCANASRLFYSRYLPDGNQDNEIWAKTYDSSSVIAYEALREFDLNSPASPYATGDAIRGGWGNTNLALYASSHVGILGGIIDTTDVEGILMLDVNRTDYFSESLATFLLYNPFNEAMNVSIPLPAGSFDIYESISNTVIATGASQSEIITIAADEAVLIVLIPTGSTYEYELNRIKIEGIIVDYNSAVAVDNFPPRVKALQAVKNIVSQSEIVRIYGTTWDKDGDSLQVLWQASEGTFEPVSTSVADWIAPLLTGDYTIQFLIADPQGGADSASIVLTVIDNHPPLIDSVTVLPKIVQPGDTLNFKCAAHDEDDDSLTYVWKNENNEIIGTGPLITYKSAADPGYYTFRCVVQDPGLATDSSEVGAVVGDLVADLSFNGETADNSGFFNHGTVSGALAVTDRHGLPDGALFFDGADDNVRIINNESLNFEEAITVHFWLKTEEFFNDREMYPISHGNWENRWKVSIGNKKIRWTVKTNNAVKDLDTQSEINLNTYYCVSCVYNGTSMFLYLNGALSAMVAHTGKISTTDYDLMLGQALPGSFSYGFKGILDDLKIFNRALDAAEIDDLFEVETILRHRNTIPETTVLFQNYPNPFNPETHIKFSLNKQSYVKIDIFDINGKRVSTLFKGIKQAGVHIYKWNSFNSASGIYFIRMNTEGKNLVRKIVKLK